MNIFMIINLEFLLFCGNNRFMDFVILCFDF